MTLLDTFFRPMVLKRPGSAPAQVLQSSTRHQSQITDEYMSATLINSLFGSPDSPLGFDLFVLNAMVSVKLY